MIYRIKKVNSTEVHQSVTKNYSRVTAVRFSLLKSRTLFLIECVIEFCNRVCEGRDSEVRRIMPINLLGQTREQYKSTQSKKQVESELPRIIVIVITVRLSPLFGLRIGRERQLKGRQRLHLRIPAIPIISVPSRIVALSRAVVVAPVSMSAVAVIRSLRR